jgi:hypothetical protein
MAEMYNDPMKGLAALAKYRNAVEGLTILTGGFQNLVVGKK